MADITTKVSVSGSAAYKSEMNQMKAVTKNLDAEMQALTAGFDKNTSSAEKNAAKQEVLKKQIENQQAIVEALGGRYDELAAETDRLAAAAEEAADKYGENSKEAAAAEAEYMRFKTATTNVGTQLTQAKAKLDAMNRELEGTGDAADEAAPKVTTFGDVLKANLAADAIKAGLSTLVDMLKDAATWFGRLIVDSAAFADEILTLSSTTGMSTTALQEYKYMAELTDVSLETITGSQTKLLKTMASAQSGGKAAADAFAKVGVSAVDADGNLRSVDEVFQDVITSLGGFENESERDAAAMELLGKSARELNPLIELGADALEAFKKEAHDVGYVLDDDQLSKLGSVDDGYQRLQKRIEGMKNQLGAELAPAAEAVFDALLNIADKVDFEKLGTKVGEIAEQFAGWLENISAEDIADGINTALDVAVRLADSLGTIADLINTLTGKDTDLSGIVPEAMHEEFVQLQEEAAAVPDNTVPYLERVNDGFTVAASGATPLSDTFEELAKTAQSRMPEMAEAVDKSASDAGEALDDLSGKASGWGADFVTGYIRGLESMRGALQEEANSLAEDVSGPLHFSRPDYGPLRDYETWMPDFMMGLSRTMEANIWRVEDTAQAAAAAIAASIDINSRSAAAQEQAGADMGELLGAVNGIGQNMGVNVVLEGDAAQIFRLVRTENNRLLRSSGVNVLGGR